MADHVCGLQGYDPGRDGSCPGCAEVVAQRSCPWAPRGSVDCAEFGPTGCPGDRCKQSRGTLGADGFSEAFMGLTYDGKAVYSIGKMIEVLVRDGCTEVEAVEYLDFNVFGAYVGPMTPIYVRSMSWEEACAEDTQ